MRLADNSEQVRSIFQRLIAFLGPLVRCEPLENLRQSKTEFENSNITSNLVSGRDFRFQVMTYNTPNARIFFHFNCSMPTFLLFLQEGGMQAYVALKPQQFLRVVQFINGKQREREKEREYSSTWLSSLFENASGFKPTNYNITEDDAGYFLNSTNV